MSLTSSFHELATTAAAVAPQPSGGELAAALRAGEVRVDLQPQVDLCSGRVVAVEALARWSSARSGPVPPLTFIPLAEAHGLGEAVSAAVLEQALGCVERLDGLGAPSLRVAVNVSARELSDVGIVRRVRAALDRSGVTPQRLTLEVTEDALSGDPSVLREVLGRLKSLGVRLSLDDFGSGYSSLGRLQSLPLDEVKIDRSFVEQLRRTDDTGVITAIAALGRHLGMTVVAEGAESEAELELLAGLGCQIAQGYAVSAPLPPPQLYAWLDRELTSASRRPAAAVTSCPAQPQARSHGTVELSLRLHQALDQTMTDSGALDVVCHTTAARLARTLGAEFAAWWRTDPNVERQRSLRCVTVWSAERLAQSPLLQMTRAMTFAAGVGLPGVVLESPDPVWVEDVDAKPALLRGEALRAAGLRSALAIPLLDRDGALGVVEFFGADMPKPDRGDMNALASIGVRLANLLVRRDATAAVDSYSVTLRRLQAVYAALETAPAHALPARLCEQAAELAQADVVGLWQPGAAPGELVLSASHGGVRPGLRTNALTEHSGVATAYASRHPLFVEDLSTHPIPSPRLAERFDARSALFQPIPAAADSRAVLAIAWKAARPAIDPPLRSCIELLAAHAETLLRSR
ncbi:EAL domain-containing protein [Conexibacter sp. CPCC 206217]|uniref:EAL domain-containing protein n=1 Tax=Conexibacter sp. CPCC 206217 TaxID=3064574 RepID=UPI002719DFC1|nr:EAL domain-containing protein [Conexibacter sp. CPCC 206217]MDO8213187.1 EAL domain-containing protein [Conexibacter sp. CPCC 206217]